MALSKFIFKTTSEIRIAGWLLIAIGGLIIFAGLITIRVRSLAPTAKDALAEGGLYSRVRHPKHSGTFLEFADLFLIRPIATIGRACALGILWPLVQTRCEEIDLLQRIPRIREYMGRNPRFFPRIG